jgi:hypothetical protein
LQEEVRTVLVIRANNKGRSTTASEAQLSDDIFGTQGDELNLKSQFLACSDGKLQFEPYRDFNVGGNDGVLAVNIMNGATSEDIVDASLRQGERDLGPIKGVVGDDGVITVDITETVDGADSEAIVEAMLREARRLFPFQLNFVDHTILCLPPGTIHKGKKDWRSYAFEDWKAVFNDKWCSYPSLQLHEIGKSSYQ